MEGANLKGSNFEDPAGSRANLEGVNLKGANLEGSIMAGSKLNNLDKTIFNLINFFQSRYKSPRGNFKECEHEEL